MCAFNGKVDYGRVHLVVKGWPSPFHSDAAAVVYRGPIFTPPPLLLRVRIVCDRPWGWLESPTGRFAAKMIKLMKVLRKTKMIQMIAMISDGIMNAWVQWKVDCGRTGITLHGEVLEGVGKIWKEP